MIKRFRNNRTVVLGWLGLALVVLPILIDFYEEYRYLSIALLIIVVIMYGAALYYYSENQKTLDDLEKRIKSSENKRKSFECMMQELQAICSSSANVLHKFVNDEHIIDIDSIWNFDDFTKICCKALHRVLLQLNLQGKDYAISYVKRVDDGHIKLVGYANRSDNCPNVYNEVREISPDGYYDARLFYNANPDCDILLTSNIIKERFRYEKICKYEQYIGMPVVDSDGTMVGLLQISAINGSVFGNDNETVRDIAVSYFRPFVSVILLFYKMDTSLHKIGR